MDSTFALPLGIRERPAIAPCASVPRVLLGERFPENKNPGASFVPVGTETRVRIFRSAPGKQKPPRVRTLGEEVLWGSPG